MKTVSLLAAIFLLPLSAVAQEKPVPPMVTRLFRLPASSILKPSELGQDKAGPIRRVPGTDDGDPRWDVWPWFVAIGVPDTKGARAVLFEKRDAVVVSAPGTSYELIERSLEVPSLLPAHMLIEMTINMWEYEDDPLAPVPVFHFAELRKKAGDSLRLLDSRVSTTKSGNRAWGVSEQVPKPGEKKPVKPAAAAELRGGNGALIEFEPVVAADGVTFDFVITYDARIQRAKGLPEFRVSIFTSSTVRDGQQMLIHNSLIRDGDEVAGGKVKRAAVFVGMRLLDPDGRTPAELAAQRKKEDEELIRRAFEGLDGVK